MELQRQEDRNFVDTEFSELLEEHAPACYKEGHRVRAVAAVRILQNA